MPAVVESDSTPADAPVGKPEPGQSPEACRTVHALKPRAAPLAAVIKLARGQALDSTDWQSVWAALVNLAQSADRPPPLLGYTEGEGVKYQNDNAAKPVDWLTREALRKRFGRRG